MSSIEHPPIASERALYASLVTPAPEPHDPRTCELCTALRREVMWPAPEFSPRNPIRRPLFDFTVFTEDRAREIKAFLTGLRGLSPAPVSVSVPDPDEPIPYRLSTVGPIIESLEQARLARVADGPVSLLPPEVEP